jgi:hypothetical protein
MRRISQALAGPERAVQLLAPDRAANALWQGRPCYLSGYISPFQEGPILGGEMQSFFSSNRTFIVQIHDDGDVWLFRAGMSTRGLLVCSDDELIELFGLICTYITDNLLPGYEWLVSDFRKTDKSDKHDDNGTDWSEDDVPF